MALTNITSVIGGKSGAVASETEFYTENYYGKSASLADRSGEKEKAAEKQRKANYDDVVTRYYDQVTDFYEYGWGQSFHFAPIREGEAFSQAQARHQHRLALKIKADKGMKVLVSVFVFTPKVQNVTVRFRVARVASAGNCVSQICVYCN